MNILLGTCIDEHTLNLVKGELRPNFNEILNKSLHNFKYFSKHERCSRKTIFQKICAKPSDPVRHLGFVLW